MEFNEITFCKFGTEGHSVARKDHLNIVAVYIALKAVEEPKAQGNQQMMNVAVSCFLVWVAGVWLKTENVQLKHKRKSQIGYAEGKAMQFLKSKSKHFHNSEEIL